MFGVVDREQADASAALHENDPNQSSQKSLSFDQERENDLTDLLEQGSCYSFAGQQAPIYPHQFVAQSIVEGNKQIDHISIG